MSVYDIKFRRRNPHTGGPQPLLWDGKPWKAPRLTEDGKPFEPKEFAPGSTMIFDHNGQPVSAQVWSDGPYPNSRWAVADGVAYLVNLMNGLVLETR